ncbi:MAG: valine--tRNA ligase [Candidatus Latescibacterota bacterium]|nr:valine--tRNA ligase [Candidatus Latescibacterota bacterium]
MSSDLEKVYDPNHIEEKWYSFWEDSGFFRANNQSEKSSYSIVIPPPNVTGELHMGHAIQHAIHDLIIRWKRMQGFEVLCLPGTDHAGIATQMKVEQQLQTEDGLTRYDVGREALMERIWSWREKYGDTIYHQMRKLGTSYDWSRTRFTLDEDYVTSVLKAFQMFHENGWIYRGKRMINWCPECRTVISDLETEEREITGNLWHICYKGIGNASDVVVATTRPETLLGDTGIAVHPNDSRWKDAVGKCVELPLVGRSIGIVADFYADPEMGSGAVKLTPCHDPNDYAVGERHNLDQIQVIGFDGKMTEAAGKYCGMDRYECREKLLEDLKKSSHFREEIEHVHAVPHHDKCGTVIEPLPMEQWFMNMKEPAEKTRKVIEENKIEYVPSRFRDYAVDWLENIRDWALSRQIWWGHRIPAWYCRKCSRHGLIPMGGLSAEEAFEQGNFRVSIEDGAVPIVSAERPSKCPTCEGVEWIQDPDVLDTWFSSALWPFATMGWPNNTKDLSFFYPTDLMITARDILYLWVLRMAMTSLECIEKIPFKTVLIHPTILTKDGRRMSKSLGTGLDPLDLVELYGADATRFSLLAQAGAVQDVRFDAEIDNNVVKSSVSGEMGRNFGNKVWNATRFVLMNLEGYNPRENRRPKLLEDCWIWSRLSMTIIEVNKNLGSYRFSDVIRSLYDFLWRDYCDWYLELAKPRLQRKSERQEVQGNLVAILEVALRLLHPVMPFITEALWQSLPKRPDCQSSIMISEFPKSDIVKRDLQVEKDMGLMQDIVTSVRTIRSEMNIPNSKSIRVLLSTTETNQKTILQGFSNSVGYLTKAEAVDVGKSVVPEGVCGSSVVSGVEVFVPLDGLVDLSAERERLEKELDKFEKLIKSIEGKLNNEKFIQNAPSNIVQGERDRQREYMDTVERIKANIDRLGH